MKTVEEFIASLPPEQKAFLDHMETAMQGHTLQAYILLGEEVVETNMLVACLWLTKHPGGTRIALDKVGKYEVSTVFLTVPHGSDGKQHFETMVFWPQGNKAFKSKTLTGAKNGHVAIVQRIRDGGIP